MGLDWGSFALKKQFVLRALKSQALLTRASELPQMVFGYLKRDFAALFASMHFLAAGPRRCDV